MNNIEIIEYIEYISVRPKMYLIKYDYEELINHISYFISFKEIFDLMTEKDILFLDKFPEWICKKYNYSIEDNLIKVNQKVNPSALKNSISSQLNPAASSYKSSPISV